MEQECASSLHGNENVDWTWKVDCKSSGQLQVPRMTLKRIKTNELDKEEIDPAHEERDAEAGGKLVKVESGPYERRIIGIPPKKRHYVPPTVDETSAKNIPTVKEEQVVEHSVAVEKAHQPEARSCDVSVEEEQKQQPKQNQMPEGAMPPSSNAAASSKMMHAPCHDEALAGTSASGFLLSTDQTPDQGIWLELLKKDFDQLELGKSLQNAKFTKNQVEVLERAFREVCQRMAQVKKNSERFLQIHNCLNCSFSISHQCLPLEYIQALPFGTHHMEPESIMPNRTVVCICGFAFFHAHLKRDRPPPVETVAQAFTRHMIAMKHSADVRCHKCYSQVIMTNRTSNVCCGLTPWKDMADDNRKLFYKAVQSCLHYPPPNTTSLDEFSSCINNCCLFFHRCSE